jgi:hypothetical protein
MVPISDLRVFRLRDSGWERAKQLKVVVSHPARQANIYYRPRAAEQMGADVTFLTGRYYRPDRLPYALVRYLPAERRMRVEYELEKRRLEGLSPENVISLLGPMLEAIFRPLGKTRQWWALHDWLASLWIRRRRDLFRNSAAVFHSFQGSCRLALRAAREAKMVRLLEVTLPPAPPTPEFAGASETDFITLKEQSRDAEFVLVQY